MKVKLSEIKHNSYNTRKDYGDLSGLKASINRLGLTQPFLVRKSEEGGYELAFGSRRYIALKEMGRKKIDVEVRDIKQDDMAMLALCENIHRKDLNAVEQARAYEKGLRATRLAIPEFADSIGVGKVTITDYLSILKLPQTVLNKSEKYGKTDLIYLGKLNQLDSSLRIMLENVLENRSLNTKFLREIGHSCESIFSSNLQYKTKKELCREVIYHDYSSLAPENYRDIKSFADAILGRAITKYQGGRDKTAKARAKTKGQIPRVASRRIRRIDDIVHFDKELDEVSFDLRKASNSVKKAIKNNYYSQASGRSQRKFKTSVNNLVSGIEEILKDEEFRT